MGVEGDYVGEGGYVEFVKGGLGEMDVYVGG